MHVLGASCQTLLFGPTKHWLDRLLPRMYFRVGVNLLSRTFSLTGLAGSIRNIVRVKEDNAVKK
jgi:hypothetical protein